MKSRTAQAAALLLAAVLSGPAFAESTGVSVSWSYEDAETGNKVRGSKTVELTQSQGMEKSVLLAKVSDQITVSLADYAKTCSDMAETPADQPRPRHRPMPSEGQEDTYQYSAKCKAEKVAVGEKLEKTLPAMESSVSALNNQPVKERARLNRLVETVRKLAKNMREAKPDFERFNKARSIGLESAMRITTGGAQDAQRLRDIVDSGKVPKPSDYQAYGLINEFDLYVEGEKCDQLLCVSPVMAIDKAARKMYVQANLGTNVKVDEFDRRPLNLGIALDLSGSMSANDDTKKSRLEWAKDAVNETLNNLVPGQDYFTLVYFSDNAQVLWSPKDKDGKVRPITPDDIKELRAIVSELKTIGSTNLRAGLDLAYEELTSVKRGLEKAGQVKNYENRVIMITDANLNTGDTDESSAMIKVQDQSKRGINLTTIGVGDNFFADFVNKISVLRGSNYIFAQNGQRMVEYFDQFHTLVTPVAYDFVADIQVDSAKAKLVRIHGVPEVKAEKATDSLLSISTLFFAAPKEKGGGAQILEFDLK